MLKSTIFIILLLFGFSNSILSQIDESYYPYIYQAEELILNDKFEAASEKYFEAFQHHKEPFLIDIHNALLCSVISKNYKASAKLVRKLILLGCELDSFRRKEVFKEFITSKQWLKVVRNYTKLKQQYYQNIDLRLRNKLESFLARDQYWRIKNPSYADPALRDSTFHEDSLIMTELIEIFKSGYPTPYQVGTFFNEDNDIEYFDATALILLHNYTSDDIYKKGIDLTNTLRGFVEDGHMRNDQFSNLYDRSGQFNTIGGYGSELLWKFNRTYYTENISDEIEIKILKNRKDIGLSDLKTARLMLKYQLESNYPFQFFTYPSISSAGLPKSVIEKVFTKYAIND